MKVLELLVWYWSRPLEELLMKSDNELCHAVRIGNTDATGRGVGAEQSHGTGDGKLE